MEYLTLDEMKIARAQVVLRQDYPFAKHGQRARWDGVQWLFTRHPGNPPAQAPHDWWQPIGKAPE